MYFIDRVALGKTFASSLEDLRGKGAIILCLKDSSILTCLTMAMQLRAWVYPLVFIPIYSEDGTRRPLGAVDDMGDFCPDYQEGELPGNQPLSDEVRTAIRNQEQAAILQSHRQLGSYGMPLNKEVLNGRDVIIVGDVLTNTLPLMVATKLLRSVKPKSLSAVVGNATPQVVDMIRISADRTIVLDVLSGITFDDEHYFEHPDTYTEEQKRQLTQHIAAYWQ